MAQLIQVNKLHPRLSITVVKYLSLTNLIEYYKNRKYECRSVFKL